MDLIRKIKTVHVTIAELGARDELNTAAVESVRGQSCCCSHCCRHSWSCCCFRCCCGSGTIDVIRPIVTIWVLVTDVLGQDTMTVGAAELGGVTVQEH